MSETLHTSPENSIEPVENSAEQKEKLKELLEKAERAEHKSPEEVTHLKVEAKKEAVSGKEYTVGEREQVAHGHHMGITKALKEDAYKKTLKQAQKKLSKPERAFSKLVHQPTIDAISTLGAKTVARPSGVLAGGICAFIGSSAFFYMSKHYGFSYNFFAFFMFLVGGFFVGLLSEAIYRLFSKHK